MCWIKRSLNGLIILIAILISNMQSPSLAYAPIVTKNDWLEYEINRLHKLEIYAIRNGLKVDLAGKVWEVIK